MKKRGKLTYKFKKNNKMIKKLLGLAIAVAGAVLIIHTIPVIAWYGILGVLIVVMIVYLIFGK